jgi:hypothetical protein
MDWLESADTSPNRAYLTSCLRHFAQIQPYGWTSDTLGTLCEMLTTGAKYKKRRCVKSKEIKNANKKFL